MFLVAVVQAESIPSSSIRKIIILIKLDQFKLKNKNCNLPHRMVVTPEAVGVWSELTGQTSHLEGFLRVF